MPKIYKKENGVPIKIWIDDINNIETSCIEQINRLSKLPYVFKHIAIMPDTHTGYGMPIGGVIACNSVVVPNAVGVDIGCGVCAMKTNIKHITAEQIKEIMKKIRKRIPLGFNRHKEKQEEWLISPSDKSNLWGWPVMKSVIEREHKSSLEQIGTLGGGNHFIEIQKDQDDYIWVMIHSGSRNLGYKIAKHYNKIASELCTKYYSKIPEIKGEDSLAFLPTDSEEGRRYALEMANALRFAKENRKRMMNRVYESIEEVIPLSVDPLIDVHHNYASLEHHFDRDVVVHRKGAIRVREGDIGIIPGSQGTKSYIVKGKGNPESFMSCSHGAGRIMSRSKARNTLNLEEEKKKLDDKNIIHSIRNTKDLDEASSAYKDIDVVMENQKDLIGVVTELDPLAVIKG